MPSRTSKPNRPIEEIIHAIHQAGRNSAAGAKDVHPTLQEAQAAIEAWVSAEIIGEDVEVPLDGSMESALISYTSGQNHLRAEQRARLRDKHE